MVLAPLLVQQVRLMRQVNPLSWAHRLSLVRWAYRVLLARHYRW
jgi:hypothetical protein